MKKILTVVGARPQFVKAAVLSRLISQTPFFQEVMIHTGQHFDTSMSQSFFSDLQIPKPSYSLNIHGLPHGAMTGRMMEEIEQIAFVEKPDMVLVYGDTNSTLAGALVGAKLHIPVAHVESGLRSYNKLMPEEVNRILTDHVSTFLFCPTEQSIKNLQKENIKNGVYHTGDIMYDATLFAKEKPNNLVFKSFGLKKGNYALLTLHRQENTENPGVFQKILDYVKEYSLEKGISILWPLHPRLKEKIQNFRTHDFQVVEPVGYFDMHTLLSESHSVLTDSGGLQKEAYFHQKQCVTLRSETEWIETIDAGWNRLWLNDEYSGQNQSILDYGQGNAGSTILSYMM